MRSGAAHIIKPKPHLRRIRFFTPGFLTLVTGFTAFAQNGAPPSPEKPWSPPGMDQYAKQLTNQDLYESHGVTNAIDPAKVYDLPALIDIAERSHPETRVAWERARQAARAIGLNQSAYYPYLAASAAAGYQHGPAPFLTDVVSGSAAQENVALSLEWLLFDFGQRRAAVAAAREQSMMANVGFNATHQRIVFAVTKSFYDFNTARQKVAVAESSLHAAQTVGDATQARFDNGLATKTDLLQAQQQTAQSEFVLESARGDLSDAQVALVDSLGILPSTQLQIADVEEKPFAENADDSLDTLIDRALAQRPDLIAKLASLRAAQATVKKARADFYPKLSLEASTGWEKLDINAYDSPYVGNSKPTYSVGMAIQLPIFDGFLRANRLHIAKSEMRAAESELADSRDQVVREVWKARTDLKTAVQKQVFAAKFLDAAQSAFDATLESYKQGLATYISVANAQQNLDSARSVVVTTRAAIFTSAAALALSVGDLAKPDPHQP
ncbi:MAG TPA: TolC family protein [Verrucomicrobiae bacterium]|nr:TolC family protein [Verrucomicrobiae bacterium]